MRTIYMIPTQNNSPYSATTVFEQFSLNFSKPKKIRLAKTRADIWKSNSSAFTGFVEWNNFNESYKKIKNIQSQDDFAFDIGCLSFFHQKTCLADILNSDSKINSFRSHKKTLTSVFQTLIYKILHPRNTVS